MKRGIIILFLVILLSSFISADITFTQSIKSVYNLGDVINLPVKVITYSDVTGSFNMDLICNGTTINFYKYSGIKLSAGEEKDLDSSLVLINKTIDGKRGLCKIKAILNGDYILSNEFKISDLLNVEVSLGKTEFNPKESVFFTGKVAKENGKDLNGFIEAVILTSNNQSITQSGVVTNGIFSLNISLPDNLKAGNYLMKIKASEKNTDGAVTNAGFVDYNISIRQIPTNLELILESKDISPGANVKIKAVLHDQTGESINSTAIITIKDSKSKIIEQKDIQTGEFFEYFIKNNELPAEWQVFAVSNKLTAEDRFNIGTKEDVDIEINNKTILITNTGNVLYNETLLVKIGGNPLNIDVLLNVGQSKKYVPTADEGEYEVRVVESNGEETIGIMNLAGGTGIGITGGAISIREISNISLGTSLWILFILILGIVIFIIFRKVYKKPFVGKQNMNFKRKDKEVPILKDNKITSTANKAEISLSIRGEKQDASVICLRIKNLRELKSRRGSAAESIGKIIDIAGENKAAIYENQDYLFFILAPTKTRTFKNEKTALSIAENINKILKEHNKMFNQKMDFGISLNYGTIVAKIEGDIFKFMSMGTLITIAKKIASLAKEEVLLGDKMNDLLRINIRTEKSIRDGTPVFTIKEIKRENEEARKFIEKFLNRQGKE